MASAIQIVLVVVVAGSFLVAVVTLAGARRSYGELGRGPTALHDPSGAVEGAGTPAGDREAEIRQLLQAKSARRVRRGEPPLDIERELAVLLADAPPAPADPALEEEVRAHVAARSAARERRGEPPLDVEAEVTRRLAGPG